MKCCNGLGEFAKCGRGLKKGCNGAHCRCIQKGCTNMHYVDCFEHYIHSEYIEKPNDIGKITLKEAVYKLQEELRKDKELYYSYQANIAVCMQDAYKEVFDKEDIHRISNIGAKKFLDLFISQATHETPHTTHRTE